MLRRRLLPLALGLAACTADRPAAQAPETALAPPQPAPVEAEPEPDPALVLPSAALPDAAGPRPPEPMVAAGPGDSELERRLAVIRALEVGDLPAAEQSLAELSTAPLVVQARALLRAGNPAEALVATSRAVEYGPGLADVLLLHGEATLQVGAAVGREDLLRASLESFRAAGTSPRALLGASRAARALGEADQALELARAGLEALRHGAGGFEAAPSGELPERPQRTLAEAALAACRAARAGGGSAAEGRCRAAEDALAELLASEPRSAWAWRQLAELQLELGRLDEAQDALLRGLERLPREVALHELLVEAARRAGGASRVLGVFERLQKRHPTVGLCWWYPAVARIERALDEPVADPLRQMRAAESDFRRCRQLDPGYAPACLRWEAVCRAAVGWTQLRAGRLDDAHQAFLGMEQLQPGAIETSLDHRVGSGLRGLALVGDAYAQRDDLERAAAVFAELHRLAPGNHAWAVSAGFFLRDSGARIELLARDLRLASRGRISDPQRLAELRAVAEVRPSLHGTEREKDLLKEAAKEQHRRAQRAFEDSYAAFLDAAALAPHDVRVLSDAALVAIHHLRRDAERARELLERCVELGRVQLEADDLDDAARLALEEAWGDAHQNLGLLHLELLDDPAAARAWFEAAREIGPGPRPEIDEVYLPRCVAAAGGGG